jgi:hypothetical protein
MNYADRTRFHLTCVLHRRIVTPTTRLRPYWYLSLPPLLMQLRLRLVNSRE